MADISKIMQSQSAVDNVDEYAILLLDNKGNIKNWNKGAEIIEGFTSEEVIGSNFRLLFSDEDRINLVPEKLMADAVNSGKVCYNGWRVRKDGTFFWADVVITAIFDEEKRLIGFTKILRDITNQKNKAEFDQSNIEALINNLKDALWSVDLEYRLLTANTAYHDLNLKLSGTRHKKGDLVLNEKYGKEQIDIFKGYYDRTFSGNSLTVEVYFPQPSEHWLEITFAPIFQDKVIIGAACHAHDVTEKKLTAQKKEADERKFQSLIESNKDGIAIFSIEGKPLYLSSSVEKLLGYTMENTVELNLFDLFHPDHADIFYNSFKESIANPGVPIQGVPVKIRHIDGSWRWTQGVKTNLLADPAINGIVENFRDVTERKNAEENQKHSEKRLKQAQVIAGIGNWEMDPITRIISFSEETSRIYGHPEIITTIHYDDWLTYIHSEDLDSVLYSISQFIETKKDASFFYRILRKDGLIKHVHTLAQFELNESGEPIFIYGATQDVTQIKSAEEKIRASEHRFRSLIENSSGGVIILSADRKPVYVSPSIKNIIGYTAEEFITMDIQEMIHPDDIANMLKTHELVLANPGKPIQGKPGRRRHKDGTWRWVDTVVTNLLHDPAIEGIVNNIRDITETKLAEDKLKTSEYRMKQAQEMAHVGSWEVDLETLLINMSEEARRIYGLPPEENSFPFDNILTYVHPDDLILVRRSIAEARQLPDGFSDFSHRLIRKDGTVRYVHVLAHFEMSEPGKPEKLVGALQDVTEMWQAEEKIRNSEHRLMSLIEHSAGGVIILSVDGKAQYASASVTNVLGYTVEEFMAKRLVDIVHPDDIDETLKSFEAVLANPGKPIHGFPGRRLHKDGTWRWIDSIVTNMLHDPAINGIINNFRDITEKKLAEEAIEYQNYRLVQAQEIANYGSAEFSYASGEVIWSDQLCRIYGFDPKQQKQTFRKWISIIHPEDLEHVKQTIHKADAELKNVIFKHRIIRPTGDIRNVQTFRVIERDHDGQPFGIYSVVQDITEMTLADQKIRASEHRFRSLIEHSMEGVGILSPEGKTLYIAPSISNVLGYSLEEISQLDIFTLMYPDDIMQAVTVIEYAMKNPGMPLQGHTSRMKHKDGSWRWMDATVTNMIHDPAIQGIVNNFRDVTDKKLADEKLINVNRLFAFTSAINHTIVHCHEEARLFHEICRVATKIGKFKMAWVGLIDDQSEKLIPVECHGDNCNYLVGLNVSINGTLLEGRGPTGTAIRKNRCIVCNDIEHEQVFAHWRARALSFGFKSSIAAPIAKSGKIIGAITLYASEVNYFDKEEIKLLEEAAANISFALDSFENEAGKAELTEKLSHNEIMLTRAQELANFGGYEVDFKTRLGVWSPQFCRIFGIPTEDNIQSWDHWVSFIHPEDKQRIIDTILESDESSHNNNFYYRIIRKDGSVRNLLSYRQIEVDANGIPAGAFAVVHDITNEITNLTQLEARNKQLEAIAWIHSHNIRGPLTTILGLCQLFDEQNSPEEIHEIIAGIKFSAEKLDTVIREIVSRSNGGHYDQDGLLIYR